MVVAMVSVALADGEGARCLSFTTTIEVDSVRHKLCLCREKTVEKEFSISIGRGGTGKKRQGDHKTPVGHYSLSAPRASGKFHLFIPINYPTEEEKKAGFSGGDVGLHGPPRWIAWWGEITRGFDWTDGCIAVGTDVEIEQISEWIRKWKCSQIIIL